MAKTADLKPCPEPKRDHLVSVDLTPDVQSGENEKFEYNLQTATGVSHKAKQNNQHACNNHAQVHAHRERLSLLCYFKNWRDCFLTNRKKHN